MKRKEFKSGVCVATASVLASTLLLTSCSDIGDILSAFTYTEGTTTVSEETTTAATSSETTTEMTTSETTFATTSESSAETSEETKYTIPDKVLDAEEEISSLTNVEGNVWINENEQYADIVKGLRKNIKDLQFEGSIVVATDDEVIFASGNGLLDINGNVVTPYTRYEISSVTRSCTAVCIMKLAEDGKLSLDATLGDFFPEYSNCANYSKTSKITVRNLLQMRSGIPDYLNEPIKFFDAETGLNLTGEGKAMDERYREVYTSIQGKPFLENMFNCSLNFDPDTKYEDSNTNYYVLALIIEKVTGKKYEQYMDETIFKPCGMTNSTSMAEGDVTAALPKDTWLYLPVYTRGTADIHSNVTDILKFDRALFGGYILNEASLAELLTPADKCACGFMFDNNVVYQGGDTSAFHASHYVLERDGKRYYIVIFSTQGTGTKAEQKLYSKVLPLFGAEE